MKRLVLLLAGFLLVFSLPAEAQRTTPVEETPTLFQIGPHVGIDLGDLQEPYVGIDARIASPQIPFVINPTYDYYFVSEEDSFWSLAGNLLYLFGDPADSYRLYGGVGLGIFRFSTERANVDSPFREGSTDIGGNVLFGVIIPAGTFSPFAEVEYSSIFSNESPTFYELKGGILIQF